MPRQGLGQAAIAAVANEEQLERFGGKWAAMAITEPGAGSDSAAIRTTARLERDEYVLSGEKIFVTAGDRAELIVDPAEPAADHRAPAAGEELGGAEVALPRRLFGSCWRRVCSHADNRAAVAAP